MYQKTYFYINSAYRYGTGFPSDDAKTTFRQETADLFKRLGWRIKPGNDHGVCDSALKEKQELYLHPMEFSGIILAEEIPEIENALRDARSFHLRETRCFDRYEDMSDEAYAAHLDEHRKEMIQAILSAYTTKRRNLFVPGDISEQIGKRFRVLRLASEDESGDMAYDRVKQLVEEMIADGRLIAAQTRHGKGVRTALPADHKLPLNKRKMHDGR